MRPPSQLARGAVKPTRNAPAAGGGATNRLTTRYEKFETASIDLPCIGLESDRSSVDANAFVDRMNTAVEATAMPTAASRPQWSRILGRARRSERRSTSRNDWRRATVMLGRAGMLAGAGAFWGRVVAATESPASGSAANAACSER